MEIREIYKKKMGFGIVFMVMNPKIHCALRMRSLIPQITQGIPDVLPWIIVMMIKVVNISMKCAQKVMSSALTSLFQYEDRGKFFQVVLIQTIVRKEESTENMMLILDAHGQRLFPKK